MVVIGLAAMLPIAIIDRLVVKRLRQFRAQEAAIVRGERWDETIDVRGHDEIGKLATMTNAMPGLIRCQLAALSDLASEKFGLILGGREQYGSRSSNDRTP